MVASCNTDATAELLLVLEMYRIALFFAHSSKSIDLIAGMLDGLELHARSAFFFCSNRAALVQELLFSCSFCQRCSLLLRSKQAAEVSSQTDLREP
jgi:hypothetical protein